MKIQKKEISKKALLILSAFIAVSSIALYGIYAYRNHYNTAPVEPITYSGPTEQDKKDAEENKKNVESRDNLDSNTQTSSQKKQVNPVITNVSQADGKITINSYVSGVFEDGGICTVQISKDGVSLKRESKGFTDATTTGCAPIALDRSEFIVAGVWSVVVVYNSASSQGESQVKTLNIQ